MALLGVLDRSGSELYTSCITCTVYSSLVPSRLFAPPLRRESAGNETKSIAYDARKLQNDTGARHLRFMTESNPE